MNYIIRKAQENDLGQIILLLKQLWPGKDINNNKIEKIYSAMVKDECYCLLCAEMDSKIIAFCLLAILNNLWVEGRIAYITTLVVDEKHRNKGIGKIFLEKIIEIAKGKNCKRIELESAFHRKEAHVFYEKNGYEKRAFFFSRGID